MKKILVSACLYGDGIYRYDGKEKALLDPLFLKWKAEGRLVPLCPEVAGGLTVPRLPAERRGGRVIRSDGFDVTEAYRRGASFALELAGQNEILFAILKQSSPSCGSNTIYDGSFSGKKISGRGITTELLEEHGIRVFDETELSEVAKLL